MTQQAEHELSEDFVHSVRKLLPSGDQAQKGANLYKCLLDNGTFDECRLFHEQRRTRLAGVRRESPGGVISHREMMTTPRYASMAAVFMRSIGLVGQYQALDEE